MSILCSCWDKSASGAVPRRGATMGFSWDFMVISWDSPWLIHLFKIVFPISYMLVYQRVTIIYTYIYIYMYYIFYIYIYCHSIALNPTEHPIKSRLIPFTTGEFSHVWASPSFATERRFAGWGAAELPCLPASKLAATNRDPRKFAAIWINNVLLVKIKGPVWYTIYHRLPVVKGINKPLY